MKHLALLLAAAFLVLTGLSTEARAQADTLRLNLQTAVQRALEISPEVGEVASDRDYAAARYRRAQASRFLTEFQATSAHAVAPGLSNPNDTPTGRLYLDPDVRNDWNKLRPFNLLEIELLQPIMTWGELSGNIRAARHGIAVEEEAVHVKELEVALRTGTLYYSLLLADALHRLTNEAGDIVERAKREIQRLLDEGDAGVDEADMFQVQITEQEFKRRVVEVEQSRMTARMALQRQLFLPEGTVPIPEEVVLEPIAFILAPLETYLTQALIHRPELAQADAGLAARSALVDVARSNYYPKLFLAANARYSYASGRYRQRNPYVGDPFLSRKVEAGLGIRQKLNFLQTRAGVEEARAEQNKVQYLKEAARQLILFEAEEAYRNLITAQAALASREEALLISKQWLRNEQINFDLEIGDTENLIKAVQANLELQAARHEAVQQYNVAVLKLQYATGVLTDLAKSGTLVD